MAKPRVTIFLTVLAVAVSMHAAPSTLHAAPLEPAMEFFQEWYTAFKNKLKEDPVEVIRKIKDAVDIGQSLYEALESGSSDGGTQQTYLTAGNLRFPVVAVDITNQVTWTNMCDLTVISRAATCNSQARSTYAMAAQQPNCGAAFAGSTTAPICCRYSTSTCLVQGPVILSAEPNGPPLSGGCELYTCRIADGGGATSAVVGLGRGGTLTSSLGGFSYVLDSNLRTNLWLGRDAAAAYAQGRSSTTPLINNRFFPNLYYVSVTEIQVGRRPPLQMGSLDLQEDGTGGVFLSTTVPFTFLNSNAYQLLKREFPAAGRVQTELGPTVDQLCYAGGSAVQIPAITLAFAGPAVMQVEAERCWYRQSDGSVCLAILPSPWTTGESVIGTMLQRGRRMSYNLVEGKLTFQTSTATATAAVAASGSGTSSNTPAAAATKPRSSARAGVDKLTAAFPFLGVWVLLLVMIIST